MKTLTIEYCSGCGYLGKAASLAELVLRTNAKTVGEVRLVPSGGGAFEVTVDGTLIYSKKETGHHPNPDDILAALA